MAKYRKKPVVIDAEQFFPNKIPWPDGIEQYDAKRTEALDGDSSTWRAWRINTLEGLLNVSPGDWIIRGVEDELYPCKPDIFEKTYEKVE